MNRSMVCFILLLLGALLMPPAVQAFSPSDAGRMISSNASSGIVKVFSKKCDRILRGCLKSCKKDQSCKSLCYDDASWCEVICPFGPGPGC
jgi:hypothetical protein